MTNTIISRKTIVKTALCSLFLAMSPVGVVAGSADVANFNQEWGKWTTWGDQKDGTYLNPILPIYYSDINYIKVGDTCYAMTSTSFNDISVPGYVDVDFFKNTEY